MARLVVRICGALLSQVTCIFTAGKGGGSAQQSCCWGFLALVLGLHSGAFRMPLRHAYPLFGWTGNVRHDSSRQQRRNGALSRARHAKRRADASSRVVASVQ